MSGLKDMEELLLTIPDVEIREYMFEAYKSYTVGAYKGCIVLTYIALFNDIFNKLEQLANVNKEAREIFDAVNIKKENQELYETDMINQLKSKKIMNELDYFVLDNIRGLRNKSAHPSGYKASAEEARMVYSLSIQKFLCNSTLITVQLVDHIIKRLGNKNFFPDNTNECIRVIVKEEIRELHPESLPCLTNKLLDIIDNGLSDKLDNAKYFIYGLALNNSDNITGVLKKQLVDKKSDNDKYNKLIVGCISVNEKLLEGLEGSVLMRVRSFLQTVIKGVTEKHNYDFLLYINQLWDNVNVENIKRYFEKEALEFLEFSPYYSSLAAKVVSEESLYTPYIQILINRACSADYNIANRFATSIEDIEEAIISYLKSEDAFKMILAVLNSASYNAWEAIALRDCNFNSIQKIKEKALKFYKEATLELKTEIINRFSFVSPDHTEQTFKQYVV